MHEMAEHLAGRGYHVLMPDLFWRLGPYTAPAPAALFSDPAVRGEWFKRVMATTNATALLNDAPAYLDYFGGKPVGMTGYCMGGRMAITVAEAFPDRVAAVAAYHPGGLVTDAPDSPHLGVGKIKARVYIGGAIDDASFTDDQRAKFAAALAEAGVAHTVELYQARHGWVPSDTPAHDVAEAARHWATLTALFKATIG
jgi:carboxymethylenebutenolidase